MNTLVAPVVDRLLNQSRHRMMGSEAQPVDVLNAMNDLFQQASELAPIKKNKEVKCIWLMIPRGDISDYYSYDDMKECGEVSSYLEYEEYWKEDYPSPLCWYELVLVESKDYRGIGVNNHSIISADLSQSPSDSNFRTETTVELLNLLTEALGESMEMLRKGTYNQFVEENLPYQFRTGVVRRSVVWEADPQQKEAIYEGLLDADLDKLQKYIQQGNTSLDIGRIQDFTGNMFLQACAIGYKACGYDGTDLPLIDQYFLHADGRDEGLTGKGHGLHSGPGIDLDSTEAWDEWYYDTHRHGGHPWEVCRGGNSTHVDLFVRNDKRYVEWKLRVGDMTEEEAADYPDGYYFEVAGNAWTRSVEAVHFYIALKEAGYSVIIADADAIIARFKGEDYVGIVPHNITPVYCEGLFPDKYGQILDFMHVYEEDMEAFGFDIEWLPEEDAIFMK